MNDAPAPGPGADAVRLPPVRLRRRPPGAPPQGVDLPGVGQIPVRAIQALPYPLTVLPPAGFVGRAVAPKAIGQPCVKER